MHRFHFARGKKAIFGLGKNFFSSPLFSRETSSSLSQKSAPLLGERDKKRLESVENLWKWRPIFAALSKKSRVWESEIVWCTHLFCNQTTIASRSRTFATLSYPLQIVSYWPHINCFWLVFSLVSCTSQQAPHHHSHALSPRSIHGIRGRRNNPGLFVISLWMQKSKISRHW